MSRPPRICYAGTYERLYPRNRLVIDALRAAGARVEEAHAPVFERVRDKSGLRVFGLMRLAGRLALAYARLLPEVSLRLLRCDALAIGYIGQGDMLLLGPLARLLGRPVLFNPLVTLTDTLVEDRGLVRAGSLAARLLGLVDRLTLRLAQTVLVDTIETGAYLTERFGVVPQRLVVLPAAADARVFYPAAPRAAQAPLDILFIGTFIPLHGIETILHAARILQERELPLRIELVGTGQTYHAMRGLADQLGIDTSTLRWTDWLPYAALGDRLRRADVALGIFDAGPKATRVVPNKVYQALACGVATITRTSPAARRLLRDGEDALLVPPADPLALANAIAQLLDDDERSRIAAGGLAAFERHASPAALARALESVVAGLRTPPPPPSHPG